VSFGLRTLRPIRSARRHTRGSANGTKDGHHHHTSNTTGGSHSTTINRPSLRCKESLVHRSVGDLLDQPWLKRNRARQENLRSALDLHLQKTENASATEQGDWRARSPTVRVVFPPIRGMLFFNHLTEGVPCHNI
jgi:hypothetical protein